MVPQPGFISLCIMIAMSIILAFVSWTDMKRSSEKSIWVITWSVGPFVHMAKMTVRTILSCTCASKTLRTLLLVSLDLVPLSRTVSTLWSHNFLLMQEVIRRRLNWSACLHWLVVVLEFFSFPPSLPPFLSFSLRSLRGETDWIPRDWFLSICTDKSERVPGPYSVGLGLPASLLVSKVQLGPVDLPCHKRVFHWHQRLSRRLILVADAMLV
jgi:hypothetical protein